MTEVMSHTEGPPSYEELFPPRELPGHLLESLPASQLPPARLLERFRTTEAPHHATYFDLEKNWAEGAGYYRGNHNHSLACHSSATLPQLQGFSLTN